MLLQGPVPDKRSRSCMQPHPVTTGFDTPLPPLTSPLLCGSRTRVTTPGSPPHPQEMLSCHVWMGAATGIPEMLHWPLAPAEDVSEWLPCVNICQQWTHPLTGGPMNETQQLESLMEIHLLMKITFEQKSLKRNANILQWKRPKTRSCACGYKL